MEFHIRKVNEKKILSQFVLTSLAINKKNFGKKKKL